MSLPDRILGQGTTNPGALARVTQVVSRSEEAAAVHEVQRWAQRRLLDIDLAARAEASQGALHHAVALFDRGMTEAGDDPVKQELVLRYLQDQNDDNRALIRKAFGA